MTRATEPAPVRRHGRMNGRRRKAKLRQVIARDAIVRCWICGEEIDRSLAPDDDMAISVDHVLPLYAGGDHRLENLSCAHRRCNTARGCERHIRPWRPGGAGDAWRDF